MRRIYGELAEYKALIFCHYRTKISLIQSPTARGFLQLNTRAFSESLPISIFDPLFSIFRGNFRRWLKACLYLMPGIINNIVRKQDISPLSHQSPPIAEDLTLIDNVSAALILHESLIFDGVSPVSLF